jgi:hypothetical protein
LGLAGSLNEVLIQVRSFFLIESCLLYFFFFLFSHPPWLIALADLLNLLSRAFLRRSFFALACEFSGKTQGTNTTHAPRPQPQPQPTEQEQARGS